MRQNPKDRKGYYRDSMNFNLTPCLPEHMLKNIGIIRLIETLRGFWLSINILQ